MDVIELQTNDSLKKSACEISDLRMFYSGILSEIFPKNQKIRSRHDGSVCKHLYLRENVFFRKKKLCSKLRHEHLHQQLRIARTKLKAKIRQFYKTLFHRHRINLCSFLVSGVGHSYVGNFAPFEIYVPKTGWNNKCLSFCIIPYSI
jgi:hypothetical protein